MSRQHRQTLCLVVLGILVIIATAWSIYSYTAENRPHQAYTEYRQGEAAQTVSEREKHFNNALQLYKQLFLDYPGILGNGYLDYNLANTYFQLQQYPWAVLYYYKALEYDPGNEKIRRNLKVTLNKLNLPSDVNVGWSDYIVGSVAMPQRWQIFAVLVFCWGLLTFSYGYLKHGLLWLSSWLVGLLALLCLLSLAYSSWFIAPAVVLLRATPLYRDAGKQYAHVLEQPLAVGSKLYLVKIVADEGWAKVRTSGGEEGFVPVDRLGEI
jgi:tetratricopeptide (TPR) repeat protein